MTALSPSSIPHGPAAADVWRTYRHGWTGWNHPRTPLPLASAIVFTLSLRVGKSWVPRSPVAQSPPNVGRDAPGLGDQRTPCAEVVCSRYGAERTGVDSNRGVAVSTKEPSPHDHMPVFAVKELVREKVPGMSQNGSHLACAGAAAQLVLDGFPVSPHAPYAWRRRGGHHALLPQA